MTDTAANDLLWPQLSGPDDLAVVETVPLSDRGLAESTYALLRRAAQLWPDRDAVIVLPEAAQWRHPVRRTFGQLLAEVDSTAQLLHDCGVRRQDAVTLLSPNCAELITATLAAQTAGIAAPINSGLSSEKIGDLIGRSGSRVLIAAGPELAEEVWASAREVAATTDVTTLFALRPTGATGEPAPLVPISGVHVAYLSTETGPIGQSAGLTPGADDLAALFHTGGTTGDPKLAAHTHANEVTNAWMVALSSALDDESTLFAALPLFHVNALIVTLLAPMARGQAVVWAGPGGYRDLALYTEFWKIVEHYRIAAMSAVPTVYSVLAQIPVDADISSLQSCIVGASALPPAVRETFEAHTGVTLLEGYGLTEATCASARSFPEVSRHESVGQRFPYQQIKAIDRADNGDWIDVPTGDIGTLAISGPTVFPGYVLGRNEDGFILDGLGKLVDGWLDTGDLGRVDAEGFVQLTGRAKDLIIRGGHNIDPAVIEDGLLAHPNVTGAAAVGSPDQHSGEVPVAYVTVSERSTATAEELKEWARDHVAEAAAAPKKIIIVDALPVTDVGKPYKLGLRADATRDVVRTALNGVVSGDDVRTEIDNGTVIAVIATDDDNAVDATLGNLPIVWRIEAPS